MREQIHAFVHSAAKSFELENPIYEFGYHTGPGSAEAGAATDCFSESAYADGEAREGVEVERLEDLTRLPFPDATARTVICTDTLQHVMEPQRVIDEAIRILTPGGILLVCSPLWRQAPDRPDDYWRPTPGAVQQLLGGLQATLIGWQGADQFPHMVFGVGCKGPVPGRFLRSANRFLDRFQGRLNEAAARVGWRRKLRRLLLGWTRSNEERRIARDYHKAHFILHLPLDQQFKHQLLEDCLPEAPTGTRLDLSK